MSVSVACTGYDARSRWPCSRPPAADVVAGCQHEHVGPRRLCDWHIDDLHSGRMQCGDCGAIPECGGCTLYPAVQEARAS